MHKISKLSELYHEIVDESPKYSDTIDEPLKTDTSINFWLNCNWCLCLFLSNDPDTVAEGRLYNMGSVASRLDLGYNPEKVFYSISQIVDELDYMSNLSDYVLDGESK